MWRCLSTHKNPNLHFQSSRMISQVCMLQCAKTLQAGLAPVWSIHPPTVWGASFANKTESFWSSLTISTGNICGPVTTVARNIMDQRRGVIQFVNTNGLYTTVWGWLAEPLACRCSFLNTQLGHKTSETMRNAGFEDEGSEIRCSGCKLSKYKYLSKAMKIYLWWFCFYDEACTILSPHLYVIQNLLCMLLPLSFSSICPFTYLVLLLFPLLLLSYVFNLFGPLKMSTLAICDDIVNSTWPKPCIKLFLSLGHASRGHLVVQQLLFQWWCWL